MAHKIDERELGELYDRREYRSRNRRRSYSPSRSCSSSHARLPSSRSRSPPSRRNSRSPASPYESGKLNRTEVKEKKYSQYASDSDFSSDSE